MSQENSEIPPQRLARNADRAAISDLMRSSVLDLFPRFYDERQTASAAVHIAHLDEQLIEDGTYFVHEANGEIVACGGWSRRAKLYTGSGDAEDDDRLLDPQHEPARVRAMFVRGDWTRRGLGRAILEACERAARDEGFQSLVLGATLPGVPLYRSFGFGEVERFTVTMPDGVSVEAVGMERSIDRTGALARENVELAQEGIDAVNRRDAEALVGVCDPDIEFHAYFSDVLGGAFKGHSGMRDYLREISETFEEFVIEIERIDDRGDVVVAHMRAHGRGVSGTDVKWQAVVATRFRDGKAWRMATRPDESEALEAVGLRE